MIGGALNGLAPIEFVSTAEDAERAEGNSSDLCDTQIHRSLRVLGALGGENLF
jgi:hypothetical protein